MLLHCSCRGALRLHGCTEELPCRPAGRLLLLCGALQARAACLQPFCYLPTHPPTKTSMCLQGATMDRVLGVVREASASIKAPIVMFTYYNPIMARGLEKFCRQAKEAGASGALGGGGRVGGAWLPLAAQRAEQPPNRHLIFLLDMLFPAYRPAGA